MLSIGAFNARMGQLDATLAAAGVELCDGFEVALRGRLDPNASYGRLRLGVSGVNEPKPNTMRPRRRLVAGGCNPSASTPELS